MLELSASAVCIIPPNQVTDKRPYRSLSLKVVVSGVLHGSESHSVLHEDTHQLDDACSEVSAHLNCFVFVAHSQSQHAELCVAVQVDICSLLGIRALSHCLCR